MSVSPNFETGIVFENPFVVHEDMTTLYDHYHECTTRIPVLSTLNFTLQILTALLVLLEQKIFQLDLSSRTCLLSCKTNFIMMYVWL